MTCPSCGLPPRARYEDLAACERDHIWTTSDAPQQEQSGPLAPTDQEGPMSGEQEPSCCIDAREADPWTEWVWHDH